MVAKVAHKNVFNSMVLSACYNFLASATSATDMPEALR